ncbi:MAG: pyruvate dehydrogenase (acetyl-transferring), homodimeric type [Kistimonas sp.]|nr:pyruvate dehydrogenase (acetyl-transferring), homodimeric type [Kistimonas sp.]
MQRDIDPVETQEWLDAFRSVLQREGEERAAYLLTCLANSACGQGSHISLPVTTHYRNTIPVSKQAAMPGDLFLERSILSMVRWNAMVMVMKANLRDGSLGGHISTFASSAVLYDVGYNHFFHGLDSPRGSDLIFYQGHASPGIYSRAWLEGRISREQLDNFRSESGGNGLSSYPHPWLMPDFWEFPTVSMGLGPLQAIYQARFMRYMAGRGLMEDTGRKVWAFLGDGETDEPESLGALSVAAREGLDNLIFVVNCNLQRLDGPVRGNGKIIQELEGIFRGAGWNVIKVVWGGRWDSLLAQDTGALQHLMDETRDGDFQNFSNKGGAWTREHFFGRTPETLKMVEHLSDEEIASLDRGGHDPCKVYTAYKAAVEHKGQPTVILVKSVKGYGTGQSGEASNVSHNVKKLPLEDLKHFRDRFSLPVSDDQLEDLPYLKLDDDSPEMKYMRRRRELLGGCIPRRRAVSDVQLPVPELSAFSSILQGGGDRAVSTTMMLNRILSLLFRDKKFGKHVVPIIPDEGRTFGMEGLFSKLGIYSASGQLYEPQDAGQVLFYKESQSGQVLQEGISEGGAHASWLAAATSYSTHNIPMVPFYVFYSMFGFQRTGDLAWAGGDLRARGFLIGATSGRTTLNGEGLQHEDGHSHLLAGTIPNCVSYDPAYGYELAVIIQDGLRRMYGENESIYYYITTMNENYVQPPMPEGKDVPEGIVRGLYSFSKGKKSTGPRVQLLGCGALMNEVCAAAGVLREDFGVEADIWGATSFNELRRDGLEAARWNRLNPDKKPRSCWVEKQLGNTRGPVIVSTDYMKLYADQIREFVDRRFIALGTDGFGRSDTRANLRRHFEVDRRHIVFSALYALVKDGELDAAILKKARESLELDPDAESPFLR